MLSRYLLSAYRNQNLKNQSSEIAADFLLPEWRFSLRSIPSLSCLVSESKILLCHVCVLIQQILGERSKENFQYGTLVVILAR